MTLPDRYFDELYRWAEDPWGFEHRWYEERKRALTLAALPQRRYGSAFEPGCSIGVLTEALATRCDVLLASDPSEQALTAARRRMAGAPHVVLRRQALPGGWPPGEFDLVVLSELLYYLDPQDLADVAGRAVRSVAAGGTLLTVHWRHPVEDYPTTGDAAQQAVHRAAAGRLVRTVQHLEDDLALTVHVRPAAGEDARRVSVGAREGLC